MLILTDRIFVWFGQYANVIEKAKAQVRAVFCLWNGLCICIPILLLIATRTIMDVKQIIKF